MPNVDMRAANTVVGKSNEKKETKYEQIALPADLNHYYIIVQSRSRLVALLSIFLKSYAVRI